MIRSILVLGGGSAGFLTAVTLKRKMPQLDVLVLRSPSIGIIGVGEGTTPAVTQHLHGYLGLDPVGFFRELDPVWKLGIRLKWGPRPHFDYSFLAQFDTRYHPLPKPTGFYVDDDLTDAGIQAAMMSRDRAFALDPQGRPIVEAGFAYHLENQAFVAWLERAAAKLGVRVTDGTVVDVLVGDRPVDPAADPDAGPGVKSLKLDDGRTLSADLFVDASGFKSVLLKGAMKEPVIDFSSTLWCDRSVVGGWGRRPGEPVHPYTIVETMDHGWSWQIDHPGRVNRGYVYCSRYVSDEQAEAEFRRKNPAITQTRIVPFPSGRAARGWVGNVVAVGNAYGFVEPLEATSLGSICMTASNLADMLFDGDLTVTDTRRQLFNDIHGRNFDCIRWFLGMHYKFNTRLQTPFWQDCRAGINCAGVERIIEYYKENGPSALFRTAMLDAHDPFGVEGYLAMLVGQRVPYRRTYVPTPADLQAWRQIQRKIAAQAENTMPVEAALAYFRQRSAASTGPFDAQPPPIAIATAVHGA
jgi:tryptophan halogenase